jgi:hypothetical protein
MEEVHAEILELVRVKLLATSSANDRRRRVQAAVGRCGGKSGR